MHRLTSASRGQSDEPVRRLFGTLRFPHRGIPRAASSVTESLRWDVRYRQVFDLGEKWSSSRLPRAGNRRLPLLPRPRVDASNRLICLDAGSWIWADTEAPGGKAETQVRKQLAECAEQRSKQEWPASQAGSHSRPPCSLIWTPGTTTPQLATRRSVCDQSSLYD